MLVWTEEYTISTLVEPDESGIKKAEKQFRDVISMLTTKNPEFVGHIMVGKTRVQKRHDIDLGGKKIPVVRLTWTIKGDVDVIQSFLHQWKDCDENPLRSFFVRRELTIPQIVNLMKKE